MKTSGTRVSTHRLKESPAIFLLKSLIPNQGEKIFKIQKQGKENIIQMIPGKKISKRYKPLEEKNYSFDLQDLNNCDKDTPDKTHSPRGAWWHSG